MVEFLLERGASVMAKDKEGNIPLISATSAKIATILALADPPIDVGERGEISAIENHGYSFTTFLNKDHQITRNTASPYKYDISEKMILSSHRIAYCDQMVSILHAKGGGKVSKVDLYKALARLKDSDDSDAMQITDKDTRAYLASYLYFCGRYSIDHILAQKILIPYATVDSSLLTLLFSCWCVHLGSILAPWMPLFIVALLPWSCMLATMVFTLVYTIGLCMVVTPLLSLNPPLHPPTPLSMMMMMLLLTVNQTPTTQSPLNLP
jgi:hypothetical protein